MTDPITPDELAEMRSRCASWATTFKRTEALRLLNEIDRLHALIERMRDAAATSDMRHALEQHTALRECAAQLMSIDGAEKAGAIRIESALMDDGDGSEPWTWHREWFANVRRTLAALTAAEAGG